MTEIGGGCRSPPNHDDQAMCPCLKVALPDSLETRKIPPRLDYIYRTSNCRSRYRGSVMKFAYIKISLLS